LAFALVRRIPAAPWIAPRSNDRPKAGDSLTLSIPAAYFRGDRSERRQQRCRELGPRRHAAEWWRNGRSYFGARRRVFASVRFEPAPVVMGDGPGRCASRPPKNHFQQPARAGMVLGIRPRSVPPAGGKGGSRGCSDEYRHPSPGWVSQGSQCAVIANDLLMDGMIAADFLGDPTGTGLDMPSQTRPCECRTDSRKLWAFSFWLQ
jgi:hypothetical protein